MFHNYNPNSNSSPKNLIEIHNQYTKKLMSNLKIMKILNFHLNQELSLIKKLPLMSKSKFNKHRNLIQHPNNFMI